jgi:hypothetical protein
MKYLLMVLVFALTACSSPKVTSTYEVMCPMSMLHAKVDTITGYHYAYYKSRLSIYAGPDNWREYPITCVVTQLNKN